MENKTHKYRNMLCHIWRSYSDLPFFFFFFFFWVSSLYVWVFRKRTISEIVILTATIPICHHILTTVYFVGVSGLIWCSFPSLSWLPRLYSHSGRQNFISTISIWKVLNIHGTFLTIIYFHVFMHHTYKYCSGFCLYMNIATQACVQWIPLRCYFQHVHVASTKLTVRRAS
jgi:hypothetical protein